MSNRNVNRSMDRIKAQWVDLERKGNAADYKRAQLVNEAREALGAKFTRFMTHVDGLGLPPRRVLTLIQMADTLKDNMLNDGFLWDRVGWFGVKLIQKIASEDGRRQAIMTLMAIPGHTSQTVIADTLARAFPGVFTKTPRTRTGAAAPTQAQRDLEHLKEQIKKLVAKGYEFIISEMDERSREILGLKGRRYRKLAV